MSKADENIDLLRLRSFVVSRSFPDAEVLKPTFMDKLVETIKVRHARCRRTLTSQVMSPFVQVRRRLRTMLTAQYMNDLTHPQSDAEADDAEDGDDAGEDAADDDDDE